MDDRKEIRVTDFAVSERGALVRLSCRIIADGFPSVLWFDISEGVVGESAVDEPNWAAVALIYPAMLSGRDLVIEADLSPALVHALQGDLQALLLAFNPQLRPIKLVAGDSPLAPGPKGKGVATGFSAGVDSFSTLILYSGSAIPRSLQITHLTVHNVGAFGNTAHTSNPYASACDRTRGVAEDLGLKPLFVATNMDELYHAAPVRSTVFEHSHSLRNVAVAHIFQETLGYFLYSSAYPYPDIGIMSARRSTNLSTAYLDPILLPLLSTERLSVRSAGAGLSRVDKTVLVAEDETARSKLDVCVTPQDKRTRSNYVNCSECWKCVRTMATLEGIGRLEEFSRVFDLGVYRSRRAAMLSDLHANAKRGNPADQHVIRLLRHANLHVPRPSPRTLKWMKRNARALKRSVIGRCRRACRV